jgi:hypothetical protein
MKHRPIDLEQFQLRLLQDVLNHATAAYWERRARDFDNAMSRPDDYPGNRTPAQHREHDQRCATVALACRRHAWLIRHLAAEIMPEVYPALVEAAA